MKAHIEDSLLITKGMEEIKMKILPVCLLAVLEWDKNYKGLNN